MLESLNIDLRLLRQLFFNIVERGKGKETQSCPNSIIFPVIFRIIFVTDCLKNLEKLKGGILKLLIFSQIEGMHLAIMSLLYKP